VLKILRKTFAYLALCLLLQAPPCSAFAKDKFTLEHQGIALSVKTVSHDSQSKIIITLDLTGEPLIESFTLENPNRIIVDVSNKLVNRGADFSVGELPLVSRIRIGQHPDKTRIVFDITAENLPDFQVYTNKTGAAKKPKSERPESVVEKPKPEIVQNEQRVLRAPSPTPSPSAPPSTRKSEIAFSVDKMHLSFLPSDKPVKDITLINRSEQTLYFTAIPYQLDKAGLPDEAQIETHNLLVSPRRFAIKAAEERKVRIVLSLGHSTLENVYRINLLAQLKPFSDLTITESLLQTREEAGLITGIAVLAIVDPVHSDAELSWARSEGFIEIENTGNVNILLTDGRACKNKTESCRDIPAKRLYPGNVWKLKAHPEESLEFVQKRGNEYEPLLITEEQQDK